MTATATQSNQYRETALRALDRLPPFSAVLQRLLADLANEDVRFDRIAAMVERDTVLASHLLRLVNSPIYGQRGRITSVSRAVCILGTVQLRNTLLSLSVAQLWAKARTPSYWLAARFNLHSVATAMFCDLIAQQFDVEFAEGAFLAGLLHDLGKLLMAVGLPKEMEEIQRNCGPEPGAWAEREQSSLGFTHAEMSFAALARWNMPEAVQNAVRLHHEAPPMQAPANGRGGVIPLAQAVRLADAAVHQLGLGLISGPADVEAVSEQDWLHDIRLQFHRDIKPLQNFFFGLPTGDR